MWEGKWCSTTLYRESAYWNLSCWPNKRIFTTLQKTETNGVWPVLTWGTMGRKNYRQRKLWEEVASPNFASRDHVQNIWAKFAQNRRRDSGSFTGHKIEISRAGDWERYGLPRVSVSNKINEFLVECKAQSTKILSEIWPFAWTFKLRQKLKSVV